MRINKISIENFRLLKNFTIDLEQDLSLIIGKNNTGKTSILAALEKFLNPNDRNKFLIDDFNLSFKKDLGSKLDDANNIEEENYTSLGIKLKMYILYDENDDLSNLSRVMMNLDDNNKYIVLSFDYSLGYGDYTLIKQKYHDFKINEATKERTKAGYTVKDLHYFLTENHKDYFKINKKSLDFDLTNNEANDHKSIDIIKENINLSDIINFKWISARRDVTNKDFDRTLSTQTSRIYKRTEANEEQNTAVQDFKDTLSKTDSELNGVYTVMFRDIKEKIREFGGIKVSESEIEIISTLQHRQLLEGNTTVIYKHDNENQLPEHYNGLGYLNLISMIFEIEILLHEFKREKEKKPADINLLFIEEPEAHTHPQMQYIFIKNIKKLLGHTIDSEDGTSRNLQYLISTHSCHIVADSNFNDIKYLKKEKGSVISKNLSDLEFEYGEEGEENNFRFLTQYLTLNRAELFFADKAIFIEGDTERILIPAMMKKIDIEETDIVPLLSQNISLVEVGAYSHIFDKFINFVGIEKSLIITDLDCYYETQKRDAQNNPLTHANGNPIVEKIKCSASDPSASLTSNNSLKYFHDDHSDLSYYKALRFDWKLLRRNRNKKWVSNRKGKLLLLFQIEENGYHARSFEDAFFHINKDFITDENHDFTSLTKKYLDCYKNNQCDAFKLAEKGVGSKPTLAIEILLNSTTDVNGNEFSNWEIPQYIKEGLLWLKKD